MNPERRELAAPEQIVFAWNYLEWGGAQMYFLGIARRLKGRASIRFVLPKGTGSQFLDFCEDAGFEVEFLERHADLLPAPGIRRKIERHYRKLTCELELVGHLRRFEPAKTLIHVELSPWQSILAIAALARRFATCSTMHNRLPDVPGWRRSLWRAKFRVAAMLRRYRLFASNFDARESLRPVAAAEWVERIPVTFTNIDPDEIGSASSGGRDWRKEHSVSEDAFVVVTVGQFIDRKGRWETAEAAAILRKRGENIVFVWVTNSEIPAGDLDRLASFGAADSFRLVRSEEAGASHLELMRFVRQADAFVLASHVEGLPIALLEAMALGVPSVSTRVNAIPEAVIDGETGLIVEPRDPESLADAVMRLKGDRPLAERLAAAGREKVIAEFNEIAVTEVAWKAYTEVFGGLR